MPTLAEMISTANQASYYSRTQAEVLAAIDAAQFALYCMATKELRGALVKTDATTLTEAWAPGQDTYALPADFGKVVQLAERRDATQTWRPMTPLELNNPGFVADQFDYAGSEGWGPYSEFSYWGPFLAAAGGWQIKVAPMPADARLIQLVYQAEYAPLSTPVSPLTLPMEATYSVQDAAVARLLQLNGDQSAAQFYATAHTLETAFLVWLRTRQLQRTPRQRPYLEGEE